MAKGTALTWQRKLDPDSSLSFVSHSPHTHQSAADQKSRCETCSFIFLVPRALFPQLTKKLDDPGVEPGTAPMLRENHTFAELEIAMAEGLEVTNR